MKSAFQRISRVGSLTGGTKWYLNEDCLLAAKRTLYAVEYRRFYLRDLESIVVWQSRLWLWRLFSPAVLLAVLGVSFWRWVDSTAGGIFGGLAIAWVALELALGPTAKSLVRNTGTSVDLRLVKRTRRAEKVLAKIDAAVRAARSSIAQAASPVIPALAEPAVQTRSEAAATASRAAATQTNAS